MKIRTSIEFDDSVTLHIDHKDPTPSLGLKCTKCGHVTMIIESAADRLSTASARMDAHNEHTKNCK